MKHIAIVAAEKSGDLIGAPLYKELKKYFPNAKFSGIGGDEMIAAGFNSLFDIKKLSVMGIVEVIKHLPDILDIRKKLLQFWHKNPPDIFIGIDAPDFNLPLAKILKKTGTKTVHYVSPSLWAWKEKRILKIKANIDLILCLFPFELDIYKKHQIKAICVGHAMTERLQKQDKLTARKQLGLPEDGLILGLFVGSRKSEIKRLLPIFLETYQLLKQEINISAALSLLYSENISSDIQDLYIFNNQSELIINACDLLLLKSGTITLEAAFLNRPQIVAYKVNPLTAFIAKRLLKINIFALPNLLLQRIVVPEFIQDNCQPELMKNALKELINNSEKQLKDYADIQLPNNPSKTAAAAIIELML